MSNNFLKFYSFLFLLSPWVLFAGLMQFHFQNFLPYQGVFKGEYPFDFFTVIDLFVSFLIAVFLIGFWFKKIKLLDTKIPKEISLALIFILLAGILEVYFQQKYEPILSSPFEYLRSLFVYPLVFVLLMIKTLDKKMIKNLVRSYAVMIIFFCLLALLQYFSGVFPGEQYDFTKRLAWPYIDYITLISSSANWVTFFTVPALIISFINVFRLLKEKRYNFDFCLFSSCFLLSALVIYLTQSYGAYGAIFLTVNLYFFRALKFKKFLVVLMALIIAGGGIFLLQKNSYKYKILSGKIDYKYENSLTSREDIFKINLDIIKNHPFLGVGLNQYQSFFRENDEEILGREFNESHIPPHAHNFFVSMWSNLGIFGVFGFLILFVGIFRRLKLDISRPAIFVLVAILFHGLIDSYYWQEEIAYTFWLNVALAYVYDI